MRKAREDLGTVPGSASGGCFSSPGCLERLEFCAEPWTLSVSPTLPAPLPSTFPAQCLNSGLSLAQQAWIRQPLGPVKINFPVHLHLSHTDRGREMPTESLAGFRPRRWLLDWSIAGCGFPMVTSISADSPPGLFMAISHRRRCFMESYAALGNFLSPLSLHFLLCRLGTR